MSVIRLISPQRVVSSKLVRDLVTREMCNVFWFHMRVTLVLASIQAAFSSFYLTSPSSLALSFTIFCNIVCMAERFWDLQLHSLMYWPPVCQCVFLVSRLLLVTMAVMVLLLLAKACWVVLVGA